MYQKELSSYVQKRIKSLQKMDTEFGENYWVIRELKAMQNHFDLEVE